MVCVFDYVLCSLIVPCLCQPLWNGQIIEKFYGISDRYTFRDRKVRGFDDLIVPIIDSGDHPVGSVRASEILEIRPDMNLICKK